MSVKIGYENLAGRLGVTVSSTQSATLNPVENVFDWLPFDFWQIDAVAVYPQISFACLSLQQCDYISFSAHDLNSLTDEFLLQHSFDGVIWTAVSGGWMPINSGVNFVSFSAVSDMYWQVLFRRDAGATSFQPKVGVIAFGSVLDIGQAPQIGFVPPLSRDYKTTSSKSLTGSFLGKSLRDHAGKMSLSFKHRSPAWVRSTWMPFHEHAKANPFFVSWDEVNYPDEAAFCWIDRNNDMRVPKYSNSVFMDVHMKAMAEV